MSEEAKARISESVKATYQRKAESSPRTSAERGNVFLVQITDQYGDTHMTCVYRNSRHSKWSFPSWNPKTHDLNPSALRDSGLSKAPDGKPTKKDGPMFLLLDSASSIKAYRIMSNVSKEQGMKEASRIRGIKKMTAID